VRVVDTSAWLEWMTDTETGRLVRDHLPGRDDWVVPTIVQLELAKWLTREVGEDAADEVIAFTQFCAVAPLTTEVALAAAQACREHRLPTADAIVYATAQDVGAELLTCDAHFSGLPGVIFIAKEEAAGN
jgi:predicted nucleic acid-binding protein